MFNASSGLVVGFLILSASVAWLIAKTKGNYLSKVFIIGVLIYYSVAVFFTIPNVMGWGVEKDVPANAKIISVRIKEPSGEDKGGIWFWINEKPDMKSDIMNMMRPDKVFIYTGSIQPRAYRIEYDKEIHKKIIEALKQQQKMKGSSFMTGEKGVKKNKKGGRGASKDKEEDLFKIINPYDILSK